MPEPALALVDRADFTPARIDRDAVQRAVGDLGSRTVTSALRGAVRDDARTRQEFLALTTRRSHD